jgi:hypothetical protein
VKLISNFIYADIPLKIFFRHGEKRIQFISGIGITTNFLIKVTQTNIFKYKNGEVERKTEKQPYDFRSINISPTVSFGIAYQLTSKLNLRAEPAFRYGIIKITDTPITAYLWSAGLNFSCYYALK